MKIKTSIAGITVIAIILVTAYGCVAPQPPRSVAPQPPRPVVPTGPMQFAATFDSASDFYSRFTTHVGDYVDLQGHHTDYLLDCCPQVEVVTNWHGDHDDQCNSPDTSRTIDVRSPDRFYWHCAPGGDPAKGHVMTGFTTTGYAIVAFSPNQVMTNVQKICWDINATDEGGGKWTNMMVVPDALYRRFAPRLDYVTAGFNTPNAPGDFNIQAEDHPGQQVWGIKDFRGTQSLFIDDDVRFYSGDTSHTTTDKAARFQHCVQNTSATTSTLTVGRPDGSTSSYTLPSAIPGGAVRVIFQDDMYNPPKRAGYDPNTVTWHWDNIFIV